jgi:histidine triad (HIT) family protein
MQVDPNCVFCKIVAGEIPSYKIWEDEHSLAFLDINPQAVGQTLVIPKSHAPYLFGMQDISYQELMSAVKTVAEGLKNVLAKSRVCLIVEGFEVAHVHVKLYPVDMPAEFNAKAQKGDPGELKSLQEKLKVGCGIFEGKGF